MVVITGWLVNAGACCTVIAKLSDALPAPFVAVTETEKYPPCVGVPESTPADVNVNPGGNVPGGTENVGAGGPRAENVKL